MRKAIFVGSLAVLAVFATTMASPRRHDKTAYPVGSHPLFITQGDFNHDGNVDLAVSNSSDNTVSILLGNGDGTFQPAVNYPAGQGTILGGIAAASLTNTHTLDIAVTVGLVGSAGGAIAILRGNGDGTFQAPVFLQTGISPLSLATADLNHDGNIDLVVGGNGFSRIFLGDGNGGFRAQKRFQFGTYGGTSCVAVADLNGDGNQDVIGTDDSGGVIGVMLGRGDGTFTHQRSFPAGPFPDGIALADYNLDGKTDVAVTNFFNGSVSVLLGVGDGTFQAPITSIDWNNPGGLVATDLNGDGIPDLLVADFGQTGTSGVTELFGRGDGTFNLAHLVGAGVNPAYVISGKFNSDPFPDFAVTDNGGNAVYVFSSVENSGER